MPPDAIAGLRRSLPNALAFLYYADRESPWLLARTMGKAERVAALKASVARALLERPLVKPLVAASGGTLRRVHVEAMANADRDPAEPLPKSMEWALNAAYELPWHDFELTFAAWGTDGWEPAFQVSRPGGNLVVQLGFPTEHASLMRRYLPTVARTDLEYHGHPVNRTGRPTLAWARLDIEDGVALVEEVQSDWMRWVGKIVEELAKPHLSQRTVLASVYERELTERYGRLWPRATLLAALALATDFAGVRTVYMHQPWSGAMLKDCAGGAPPVSLYTALPRAFGFVPSSTGPAFLERRRRRDLKRLRRDGRPLFWRLDLAH